MVQDRTSLRSAAVLAAKLLFAGLVFYGLWRARLLDFTQFPVLLHSPAPLVGAALMLFSTNILVSLRWHMLLAAQGIHVRRGQAFRVTYLASLAGVMLPGMVGGELVRVAMGRSFPRARIHELALSVVADRLVGLMALLLVGMTASLAVRSPIIKSFALDENLADISAKIGAQQAACRPSPAGPPPAPPPAPAPQLRPLCHRCWRTI